MYITLARRKNLQSKKQEEGLNRVKSSIDKVTHEQVVGFWAIVSDLKQLFEVIELAMDITTDLASQ